MSATVDHLRELIDTYYPSGAQAIRARIYWQCSDGAIREANTWDFRPDRIHDEDALILECPFRVECHRASKE